MSFYRHVVIFKYDIVYSIYTAGCIYNNILIIEIEIEIVFIILESTQNFSKRESRYRT